MTTPKSSKKRAAAERKKTGGASAWDEKRYPQDLGMRWFHQGAHLPDDAHDTENADDLPDGRLRLTRTKPGGWGRA